ncbi:MAG: dCTP deaminase [Promethearchaeota archaeon]
MSLLTDTDLKEVICTDENWEDKNKTHIYPFTEACLTPVCYDLRIGNLYSSILKTGPFKLMEGDKIIIEPGDTVLITTLEKVGMAKNRMFSALILSKVSKVSNGLSHISTTIDPDWDGKLLIAVHNHSMNKVELNFGEPFCTVVFFENKSPSTKDCGKIPGRLDVFVNEWSNITQKARKKERLKSLISPGIILLSLIIGYFTFGNNPGFIATVAGGVALSQLIMKYI